MLANFDCLFSDLNLQAAVFSIKKERGASQVLH